MKGVIYISFLLLAACTQYKDTKALCKGYVHTISVGLTSNTIDNEEIAMRLENDVISFSGNTLLLGNQIKICKIGSIEFAKKDELYFDTAGCTMTGKDVKERQYGTYNFITKKLYLSNESHGSLFLLNEGGFTCADVN